jgi:A/G-specific adenine glycosylase
MEIKKVLPELLLKWYRENGRSYVWRRKKDPYGVLMAEIMLQRTRADQVEPVYLDFIEKFPNAQELRKATEEEIGEYFGRLGLLWRAKLVKRLVEEIVDKFDGEIPKDRDLLLSLPAVGEYIADAVLCFASDEDVAVVDSNVCRIIGRVFDLKARGEARKDPKYRQVVDKILPSGKAKEFNWALIDLGALICKPNRPLCGLCPLERLCQFAKRQP